MLKNSLCVLILPFLVAVSCIREKETENLGVPIIKFNQLEFDFGTILMGEKVVHRFTFKNNGDGNLLLKNVSADCGCTVVDYKKGPIAPGHESYIEAVFDSDGFPGLQIKKLSVLSNASDSAIVLTISATVDYSLEDGF